jgi:hypothetical protein
MKKTIKMVNPAEGDQQEIEYWKTKTPKEKLDILQYLREEYYIFKNKVKYLIVGGYAFAFYAEPRFTAITNGLARTKVFVEKA